MQKLGLDQNEIQKRLPRVNAAPDALVEHFDMLYLRLSKAIPMDSIHFSGALGVNASKIDVRLLLMQFEDENHIFFVYSPHLDLTGYGRTLQEAKIAFDDALNDFFDYTVKQNTLHSVLDKLGWSSKRNANLKLIPSIQSIISKNDYLSEIFDKYQVNTLHKDISLPVIA